jgi:hypothetical protein
MGRRAQAGTAFSASASIAPMRPRSADRLGIVAVVLLALALRRDKARSHDPDPVSKAVLVDGMHGCVARSNPTVVTFVADSHFFNW